MNQTDPDNETSRFADLLRQTTLLKDKIDALASASGEGFNIFTILDRETDKVTRISYESDIIGWLDACIKEVARIPQIRELLVRYQNLLRKITGTHDGNLTMVLEKILTEKQGETYNFELVPALYDALKSMRIEVEWQFWESLQHRLLAGRKESGTWCLEEVSAIDGALGVTKEVIESAHTQGRNREWEYGWTFRIRPDHELFFSEPSEILLRVEHERGTTWSWVFFAFILAERAEGKLVRVKQRRLRRDTFGRTFTDRARTLNGGLDLEANDWWLGWRYPRRNVSFRAGTSENNDLMRRLLDDRQAVVDEFAKEVEEVVEALVASSIGAGRPAE